MSAQTVYAALLAYAIIGLVIAVAARRQSGTGMVEFFLAGRNLGGLVSALSYSATTYSAFMMVGLAGLTYTGGVGALGFELIYFAGLGLVALFGPRFWLVGKRFDYVTPSQMLGGRYDHQGVAVLSAIASAVFLIPYSAVQLMGIGYLVEGMTGGAIPFLAGITVGAVLAVLWALLAGLRSVAWTDSLQAAVMLVTAVAVVGVVVAALGGFSGFFGAMEQRYPEYLSVPGPGFFDLKTFIGLTLPWFFFSISNPQVSQRLFAPRGIGSMRTMLLGFLSFGFIYTLVSIFWGFSARLLFPNLENPDLATPTLLASEIVPSWLGLIVMLGIIAAAISTIDSILLTLSSMLSRDVFRAFVPGEDEIQEVNVSQIIIIGLAVLAFLFARLQLDLISILSVASSAGLLVMVPAIIGAFFWKEGTAAGAITSIVSGGLVVLLFTDWGIPPLTGVTLFGFSAAVWGFVTAVLTFVIVSWFTTPPRNIATAFVDTVQRDLRERGVF